MEACLGAADRLDKKLNVFVTRVDREALLQQAADVDRRRKAGIELGPLAGGIPSLLRTFTSRATYRPLQARKFSMGTGPTKTHSR